MSEQAPLAEPSITKRRGVPSLRLTSVTCGVVFLLIFLAAACGGEGGVSTPEPSPAATMEPSPAPTAKPTPTPTVPADSGDADAAQFSPEDLAWLASSTVLEAESLSLLQEFLDCTDATACRAVQQRWEDYASRVALNEPPPAFQSIHEKQVASAAEISEALRLTVLAMETGDATVLEEANQHFREGQALTGQWLDELSELKGP